MPSALRVMGRSISIHVLRVEDDMTVKNNYGVGIISIHVLRVEDDRRPCGLS